jgi:hypothetical protein
MRSFPCNAIPAREYCTADWVADDCGNRMPGELLLVTVYIGGFVAKLTVNAINWVDGGVTVSGSLSLCDK